MRGKERVIEKKLKIKEKLKTEKEFRIKNLKNLK